MLRFLSVGAAAANHDDNSHDDNTLRSLQRDKTCTEDVKYIEEARVSISSKQVLFFNEVKNAMARLHFSRRGIIRILVWTATPANNNQEKTSILEFEFDQKVYPGVTITDSQYIKMTWEKNEKEALAGFKL